MPNTDGLISLLRKVKLHPNDILVKADVKEYFMSGTHDTLAAHTSEFAPPELKKVIRDSVEFLLYHQVVNLDEQNCSVHRVVEGAGMGLNASGDIADCSFLVDGEVWILKESTKQKFNIKCYVRCKDDIFFVLGESEHRTKIAKEWDRACPSSCFTIDQWEASLWSVSVLDHDVYRSSREASFCLSRHTSKSHHWALHLIQAQPTASTSIASWPHGELDRFAKKKQQLP